MKISDALDILKIEKILKRTPCGRPITEYALNAIEATLSDTKNYNSDALSCSNCCIILSSLLFEAGCKNCGGHDTTKNIDKVTKGD